MANKAAASSGSVISVSASVPARPRSSALAQEIAKAAGVDWGKHPTPPRMVELQRRNDALVAIAEAGKLTLHDVKDHHEYLAGLTSQIAEEGETMKTRFRLASAQALRSSNAKRAAQYDAQARAIQRRQATYNKEVAMTQGVVECFKSSPAYRQTMELLETHWIKTDKNPNLKISSLK